MQKARVWLKPSTIFGNSRCLKFAPSEPLAVRKQPKCALCDTVLYIVIASWKSNARENLHWISPSGVLVLFLVECTLPEIISHFKHREYKFVLSRQELVAGHGDDPGQARNWKISTYCSKFSIFWWHSRLKHSNDWSGNILKVKGKWKHQSIGVYRLSVCLSIYFQTSNECSAKAQKFKQALKRFCSKKKSAEWKKTLHREADGRCSGLLKVRTSDGMLKKTVHQKPLYGMCPYVIFVQYWVTSTEVVIEPLCGWLLSLGHIFFEEPGEKTLKFFKARLTQFGKSDPHWNLEHRWASPALTASTGASQRTCSWGAVCFTCHVQSKGRCNRLLVNNQEIASDC